MSENNRTYLRVVFSECILVSLPLVIWVVFLLWHGKFSDILKQPEMSFIALIFATEALRAEVRTSTVKKINEIEAGSNLIIQLIIIILCAIILILDMINYKSAIENTCLQMIAKVIIFIFSFCIFIHKKNYQIKSEYNKIIEYTFKNSSKFYDNIAKYYDERNSVSYRAMQLNIVNHLRNIRDGLNSGEIFKVLDLGSGTGRVIAEHFYNHDNVSWTAVDNSKGMHQEFKANFCHASVQPEFIVSDLSDFKDLNTKIVERKYNAIILSYTLSALPANPDWQLVKSLLPIGGQLIIAEGEQSYLQKYPTYNFTLDDINHRFVLRSIDFYALEAKLKTEGFNVTTEVISKSQNESYGYIIFATLK